jgi:hypothetical protein
MLCSCFGNSLVLKGLPHDIEMEHWNYGGCIIWLDLL